MSRQLSEEDMRQLEAELDRLSVDDVLAQTVVTLINIGARKAGLVAPPGAEVERDLPQARKAIDGARVLLPLLEGEHAEELAGLKNALSQLQLAYVQISGTAEGESGEGEGAEPAPAADSAAPAAGAPAADPSKPGAEGPGPAQSSGRLWVPDR